MNHPPDRTSAAIDGAARHLAGFLLITALAATVLWLASGLTTVEPGQRAVVLRWGAVDRVVGSGLILAWPSPIERIVPVPGDERLQSTEIRRFAVAPPPPPTPLGLPPPTIRNDSGCLTGDAGLVHLVGTVAWTIEDPAAWVTATRDGTRGVERALERSFAAAAIAVCARRSVDGILVVGHEVIDEAAAQARERLRGDLLSDLATRVAGLGLGIRPRRVDVTVELPAEARPAFAEVLSAGQTAERLVAEARAHAERVRQEAALARAQRLSQAEATARELVSRARVATEAFTALTREQDPVRRDLLRQRLARERYEAILRKVGQVVAVDRQRPVRLWLPGTTP